MSRKGFFAANPKSRLSVLQRFLLGSLVGRLQSENTGKRRDASCVLKHHRLARGEFMSDVIAVEGQHTEPGLSQVERVVDTFIAPTKTFTDILRSTTWWLPFLLAVLVTLAVAFAIDKQV